MSPAPYTVTKSLLSGPELWSTRTAFFPACEASMASPTPQGKEDRKVMGEDWGGEERRVKEKKEGMEEEKKEKISFPLSFKSSNNLWTALSDFLPISVLHIGL